MLKGPEAILARSGWFALIYATIQASRVVLKQLELFETIESLRVL
ncbi:MAG TPA: hypothetical protein VFF65_04005 [Phycisphaerales bacterium]|nr:hypothetical protein [Phycisphaerales bacterium]